MVSWFKRGNRKDEPPKPQPVVRFTDAARVKMLEVMESRGILSRGAVRITVQNPGAGRPDYGMALEESAEPRPDDTAIAVGQFAVLVDAQSLAEVDGATVDFFDDLLRPGFVVEPPGYVSPHAAAPAAARPNLDLSDPTVAAVHQIIEYQVNPGIASHGGQARLIDVRGDVAYVELGGGCQGCSMASVTLKQGVERMILQAVPTISEVVDVTDHAGGSNPYYAAAKGGAESPFHQASKG